MLQCLMLGHVCAVWDLSLSQTKLRTHPPMYTNASANLPGIVIEFSVVDLPLAPWLMQARFFRPAVSIGFPRLWH
jgi:hypothetical protein